MHTGQRLGCQHLAHDLDSVVMNDAKVGELMLANALEQRADAGKEHFDT